MSALADISGNDVTAAELEDLVRVAAMVQNEIDLRSGTPSEAAVRGKLIRQFYADCPEGWRWEMPIDDERLYDLSWVELVQDDGRKSTLWKLFKAWYDNDGRDGDR